MAWTYSDWVTEGTGTALRLSRLRLHIQEVSDKVQGQKYSADGGTTLDNRDHSLGRYLDSLHRREKTEEAAVERAAGRRPLFSRGRPRTH